MGRKKFNAKELWLLLIPTVGLAAFGFAIGTEEAPPKFLSVTTRRLTAEEQEFSLDPKLDTRIEIRVRYSTSLRFNWFGGETPDAQALGVAFYDQNGKAVHLRQDERFTASNSVTEADVYGLTYDIALVSLPRSVTQLHMRAKVQVADKWIIPIASLIYKR